jgi:GDP-4-dehydro-6-deoxy-D-mannose reductase
MLLIGARGFLGGHLRGAAEEAGVEMLAAGRGEGYDLQCDLLDPASVEACVRRAAPASVVNMAGSPSVAESWRDPAASFAVNAAGVLNLLEAVSGHAPDAHLTCISSAQVYGEPEGRDTAFEEGSPLRPLTPYGAAKAAMEAIAGQYARARGLRVAVARLFNQLGPGQSASQATAEFARDISLAEARGAERVELAVANPGAARDFTDARDTARALLDLAAGGVAGTFNVCSGRLVGLGEVIELLAGMTELEVTVAAGKAAAAGPSASFGDPARLRAATGWEPRIPLERSLVDLLEWWRQKARASP